MSSPPLTPAGAHLVEHAARSVHHPFAGLRRDLGAVGHAAHALHHACEARRRRRQRREARVMRPLLKEPRAGVDGSGSGRAPLTPPRPGPPALTILPEPSNPKPQLLGGSPSSSRLMGGSWRTTGRRRCTAPPPLGGAPRAMTRSSVSPSSPVSVRSSGSVTVRQTSTPGSCGLLVTPRNVMDNGFLPNRQTATSGSRNQPMPRLVPQSCSMPGPAWMKPGL